VGERAPERRLFLASAAAALALHAWLLLGDPGLSGGADLGPHLRLIQQMGEAPGLRSVYPPAFHAAGALLAPVLGLAWAVKALAWLCAAALIAGFRSFQRAAGLPVASAALFPWTPYLFALSWCLPKLEAAGYALAFAGLGCLLRERRGAAGALLAATCWVHTAAALVFGLCAGALSLARRDARACAALAGGALAASPLVASHLAAGCTLPQALLFSPGDYLRAAGRFSSAAVAGRIAALAGPVGVAAALLGAPRLWRERRDAALLSGVILVLCLNELWLAPFGIATTLNLLRSLTLFAFPVAAAGGMFAAAHPRVAPALLAACAVFALCAALFAVPGSCHRVPVDLAGVAALEVDRCTFRWWIARRADPAAHSPSPAPRRTRTLGSPDARAPRIREISARIASVSGPPAATAASYMRNASAYSSRARCASAIARSSVWVGLAWR
jgi:hypothetical protein